MNSIEKSIVSNLEGEKRELEKKATTSSEIARLHKGTDEDAIQYRKTLQRWD